MMTCMWWRARNELHAMTRMWWRARRDMHMMTWSWRRDLGTVHENCCTWIILAALKGVYPSVSFTQSFIVRSWGRYAKPKTAENERIRSTLFFLRTLFIRTSRLKTHWEIRETFLFRARHRTRSANLYHHDACTFHMYPAIGQYHCLKISAKSVK